MPVNSMVLPRKNMKKKLPADKKPARGRPKKKKSELLSCRLTCDLTPAEYDRVTADAAAAGRTIVNHVRGKLGLPLSSYRQR